MSSSKKGITVGYKRNSVVIAFSRRLHCLLALNLSLKLLFSAGSVPAYVRSTGFSVLPAPVSCRPADLWRPYRAPDSGGAFTQGGVHGGVGRGDLAYKSDESDISIGRIGRIGRIDWV